MPSNSFKAELKILEQHVAGYNFDEAREALSQLTAGLENFCEMGH